MSSTQFVNVHILSEHEQEFEKIQDMKYVDKVNQYKPNFPGCSDMLVVVYELEVPYGDFLTYKIGKKLTHLGIPYWFATEDEEGMEWEVFSFFNPDGTHQLKERHTHDRYFDFEIVNRWLNDPELGVKKLKEAIKQKEELFKDPSWENQIEYGKRYRTLKLIGAA